MVGGLATLETATSLYSQHSHELLWDLETDTKAVVAWGTSHVVVAFAGTSSMANVLTNLKVKAGRRRGMCQWGGGAVLGGKIHMSLCSLEKQPSGTQSLPVWIPPQLATTLHPPKRKKEGTRFGGYMRVHQGELQSKEKTDTIQSYFE